MNMSPIGLGEDRSMPRENKTKYALLGFLSHQPLSGYDLKKWVDGSLANFWSESFGQIYPILKRLADERLITRRTERTAGRPDRHVNQITVAGRQALHRWLARPAEPVKYRLEVLLKVLFGAEVGPQATREHVAQFRVEQLEQLQRYHAIEAELQTQHAGLPELPYWLLTVRCGLRVSQAFIDWCDEAAALLDELDGAGARPAQGRSELRDGPSGAPSTESPPKKTRRSLARAAASRRKDRQS